MPPPPENLTENPLPCDPVEIRPETIGKMKPQRRTTAQKKTRKSARPSRTTAEPGPTLPTMTALHDAVTSDRATGERHAEELRAMTAERDALAAAREQLAEECERARARHAEEIGRLMRERDELTEARAAISTQLAEADELRPVAPFHEKHAREVEALTNERDDLLSARNELRDYLEVIVGGHRQELETLRQELRAVRHERRATQAVIERDRLSSRKQLEFFTDERDTLASERDEAISELTHERQTLHRQVELRQRECENLAAQRSALLTQLSQLREAQKNQTDLFGKERLILIAERDALAATLDHARKSLGMDRVTLLQKKLDADTQLAAATHAHRQEVEAIQMQRDAALEERDAAVAELTPVRTVRDREMAALGTLATSKYVACDTDDHRLGGRRRVKDAVIEREVEMKVCGGEETSAAAHAELLEEIRHLGRLQHPHIPPIYEAGLDETGRAYYTVRNVAGTNLREVLHKLEHGKVNTLLHFTLKRLLGVFHKICDAVAYAHAQGMTHGNLLPENIILGDFGDVLVTGWSPRRSSGVAAAFDDTRTDLMALGRLLYEIATLEAPPELNAVRPESVAQKGAPGPRGRAAQRTPRHYWNADRNVKTLVTVACRALDPRAHDQFQSVREFQTQVDTFKDTFEDPARLTLLRVLHYWTPGRKAAAAAVLAFLVLGIGALGFSVGQKYLAYRAHQLEQVERMQKAANPPALPRE